MGCSWQKISDGPKFEDVSRAGGGGGLRDNWEKNELNNDGKSFEDEKSEDGGGKRTEKKSNGKKLLSL